MGKTTDAFSAKLDAQYDTTVTSLKAINAAVEAMKKAAATIQNLAALDAKRTAKIQSDGNPSASKLEELRVTDNALNKIGELIAKQSSDYTNALKQVENAQDDLKKVSDDIVAEVKKFEGYINKKESSKNPFKSKKSLPKAKGLLAAAKQLADVIDKKLGELRDREPL